jgi:uncharacterized protein (DUF488 family)
MQAESIVGERELAHVFTVGHSTHELGKFIGLLSEHGVERLVDVRKVPKSRRMPHFGGEALSRSLPEAGIAYEHMGELGGFRKPVPGSPNGGWQVPAFQGYADFMQTPEFDRALGRLMTWARERPTAIMCAEAQWHRCHRRLISDALVVRAFEVRHIWSDSRVQLHELTPFAVVEGERIAYPPEQVRLDV